MLTWLHSIGNPKKSTVIGKYEYEYDEQIFGDDKQIFGDNSQRAIAYKQAYLAMKLRF